MKQFYLISTGLAQDVNGRPLQHGQVIASYDLDITDEQHKSLSDLLSMVPCDLVDKDGLKEYQANTNRE